jgi:hypothetical protein
VYVYYTYSREQVKKTSGGWDVPGDLNFLKSWANAAPALVVSEKLVIIQKTPSLSREGLLMNNRIFGLPVSFRRGIQYDLGSYFEPFYFNALGRPKVG